ncbi:hypothetical protein JZU46_01005 [bacterium]|nr:hypothetical protein [bacterium]
MIELELSAVMTEKGGIEDRLIRIPEGLRSALNLTLGEFVIIQGMALQVDKVYKDDFILNPNKAFVTVNIFEKVGKTTTNFEIAKHITLGCDPEFFLVDKTNNCLYNPAFLFKKQGSIGHDGMAVELRPQPSLDQDVVVQHLYELIKGVKETLEQHKLNNLDMIARSSGWGLFTGFHIHMGIPKNLLAPQQKDFGKILKILVKALDYYVGTLAVLAEKNDSARRCSPFVNYGKVSDFRISQRTLEYRVPGGALLRHPGLASGLLGMCSLVVHDLVERLGRYTNNFADTINVGEDTFLKDIYPNILESDKMFGVICTPTTQKAEEESLKILSDFKYMTNYKHYKNAITTFMNLKDMDISSNMWDNWQNTR